MGNSMMDVMAKVFNHMVGSVVAAVLFSVGWWIFIDGVAYGPSNEEDPLQEGLQWYGYIPAFAVTFVLLMINLVSLDDMTPQQQGLFQTKSYAAIIKVWLFVWITLGMGCVAGGITIYFVLFPNQWIGIAVMLQPIIVLVSAVVWLVTRRVPGQEQNDDFI